MCVRVRACACVHTRARVCSDGGIFNNNAEEKLQRCGGAMRIFSNIYAFAALCKDGSIVAWGQSNSML